jgi:hypothetical protein
MHLVREQYIGAIGKWPIALFVLFKKYFFISIANLELMLKKLRKVGVSWME